jgi:hypothetical protein
MALSVSQNQLILITILAKIDPGQHLQNAWHLARPVVGFGQAKTILFFKIYKTRIISKIKENNSNYNYNYEYMNLY